MIEAAQKCRGLARFSQARAVPTPDDIRDAANQIAADGLDSASNDLGSYKVIDPEKLHDIADRQSQTTSTSNANRGLRFTRLIPPGSV